MLGGGGGQHYRCGVGRCGVSWARYEALYEVPAAAGNVPTNITLGQASWAWAGFAPGVNARTQLTLAQASWLWTGFAPRVNAKTQTALGQASWLWSGRPATTNQGGVAGAIQSLLTVLGCG